MRADVHKLNRILEDLIEQKNKLKQEIKILSLKGRPLPPIPKKRGKQPSPTYGEPDTIEEKELFKNFKYKDVFKDNPLVPSQEDSYYEIYMENVEKEKRKRDLEHAEHKLPDEAEQIDISHVVDVKFEATKQVPSDTIDSDEEFKEDTSKMVTYFIKEKEHKKSKKKKPKILETIAILEEDEKYKEAQQFSEMLVDETIDKAIVTITKRFVSDVVDKAVEKVQRPLIGRAIRKPVDQIIEEAIGRYYTALHILPEEGTQTTSSLALLPTEETQTTESLGAIIAEIETSPSITRVSEEIDLIPIKQIEIRGETIDEKNVLEGEKAELLAGVNEEETKTDITDFTKPQKQETVQPATEDLDKDDFISGISEADDEASTLSSARQ